MKLVLVSGNYAPHFEGGTERVVRAQARELAALGHDVSIISGTGFTHRGEDCEQRQVDGLPVVFMPRLFDEYYDIHYNRPRLNELVLEQARGADWVHVHHWYPIGMDLVRALAKQHRVAITFHDLFSTCPRFFRDPPQDRLRCPERGEAGPCLPCIAPDVHGERSDSEQLGGFARRAEAFEAEARAARLLFAPSATHAGRIEELLGLDEGAVRVLPHGLCTPVQRTSRAEIWDGSRPLVVLHPGHRTRSKGTLDLVLALTALPTGSVELILAGSEVESGFDAELDSAAGGLSLRRLPAYEPEELSAIVAACDLVALPSRAIESYGLVLDEALAAGAPTWVSDRGALFERVGAAGRVLPAENPKAWTEEFRKLLADPGQHRREREALPDNLPGAEQAARRLDSLYQQALESTNL